MAQWRVRDLHRDDLDAVLRLWTAERAGRGEPVYALAEVLASCEKDHALVAVADGVVIGAAVARAAHDQGWIVFFSVQPALAAGSTPAATPDAEEVAAALLAAVEASMAPTGVSTLSVLLPEDVGAGAAFADRGYEQKSHVRYLERTIPVRDAERRLLADLGGRVLGQHLWDAIGGMTAEKDLLEQRLVLPLSRPGLAAGLGVVPPRAVVLFGPPGTGKTTFARAIASRLEWPFVEIFPSRLADGAGGLAGALRATFEQVAELENAVVFIDEVEEIAGRRGGEPPSPLQGVTNELLKLIPAFREQPGRLLVCATNFIRALDAAFLRHGRFDYVVPIGLPDDLARRSIWARLVPAASRDAVDLAVLATRTAGFSPADIEHAARRASQRALERVVRAAPDEPAPTSLTTAAYLEAIAATRVTVSPETAQEFEEDIAALARL